MFLTDLHCFHINRQIINIKYAGKRIQEQQLFAVYFRNDCDGAVSGPSGFEA